MKLPGTRVELTEEVLMILGNPPVSQLTNWTRADLIMAAWRAGYEVEILEVDVPHGQESVHVGVVPELSSRQYQS